MKDYANTNNKIAKNRSHLRFLLECQKYGIIPPNIKYTTKHLVPSFQTTRIRKLAEKIEDNLHGKLNKLRIKQTNITIHFLSGHLIQIKNILRRTLDVDDFTNFTTRQATSYKMTFDNTELVKQRKLQQLKDNKFKQFGLIHNSDWLINHTNVKLPRESEWLLSMGHKFALPVHRENLAPIHIIAGLEQGVQTIQDDKEKDATRNKIANQVINFKRRTRNTEKEKYILAIYKDTESLLRKYKNRIIITTADKGNKTVIMYKDEYYNKMNKLLEDRNTYRISRTDPTAKLQTTNNNIIQDLYKNQHIDIFTKHKLTCNASNAPRLYGLPKIHKPDVPLRPISSSTNLPCYTLAKHIGDILRNIISTEHNVKNSKSLKSKLDNIILDKNDILISFDVVSLFTNIPTTLAIRNIMDKWNIITQYTEIPRQKFLKILNFCLIDNNYFNFDSKTYTQTYGMPMGSPLSPTVADIVLDKLLDETYINLNRQDIQIKFLAKYVDDIFAIVNRKDIDSILDQLNKYHNKLQFTTELETDGCIPFLDIKIHRENDRLITNWYKKSTSSSRLINFDSTQPNYQKINTARNFINTVIDNSHHKFHKNNYNEATDILLKNNYPLRLIKNLIYMKKNSDNLDNSTRQTEAATYVSIPYIPTLTDQKYLHPIFNNTRIRFAYKPSHTLKRLFTKTKTPIESTKQHNVVYQIRCKGNDNEICEQVYIGTTKRSLEKRMTEHKADIRNRRNSTALSQHMLDNDHTADFDNTKILEVEHNYNKRFTLESLHIQQKLSTTMNAKEDKDKINSHYQLALTLNGRV